MFLTCLQPCRLRIFYSVMDSKISRCTTQANFGPLLPKGRFVVHTLAENVCSHPDISSHLQLSSKTPGPSKTPRPGPWNGEAAHMYSNPLRRCLAKEYPDVRGPWRVLEDNDPAGCNRPKVLQPKRTQASHLWICRSSRQT